MHSLILFSHLILLFQDKFGVRSLRPPTNKNDPDYNDKRDEMMAALYLQVSIISQALIFVTRSRSWSFVERPGFLLLIAFCIAQLVSFCILYSVLVTKAEFHYLN